MPPTKNPFFVDPPSVSKGGTPKVSKGRPESPLVASAEAKLLAKQKKARRGFPLPPTKNPFFVAPIPLKGWNPEGFQRAIGKPFGRLRRGETLSETKKARRGFPLPSTRNQFLVRGFVRLRADEVLSPRGKVPKGRRGRPKGACLMAAPLTFTRVRTTSGCPNLLLCKDGEKNFPTTLKALPSKGKRLADMLVLR